MKLRNGWKMNKSDKQKEVIINRKRDILDTAAGLIRNIENFCHSSPERSNALSLVNSGVIEALKVVNSKKRQSR